MAFKCHAFGTDLKILLALAAGKENFMNEFFDTTAIDDIRYGDEDFDQGEFDNAKLMYLSAIAKSLVRISEELRKMNGGE